MVKPAAEIANSSRVPSARDRNPDSGIAITSAIRYAVWTHDTSLELADRPAWISVSEADTARTILVTLNETGELIDPHTAVAVSALRRAEGVGGPVVVMSTAHPAKFPEAVAKACGVTPELPRGVANLVGRPERFDRLPAEAETIKAYVRAFSEA